MLDKNGIEIKTGDTLFTGDKTSITDTLTQHCVRVKKMRNGRYIFRERSAKRQKFVAGILKKYGRIENEKKVCAEIHFS